MRPARSVRVAALGESGPVFHQLSAETTVVGIDREASQAEDRGLDPQGSEHVADLRGMRRARAISGLARFARVSVIIVIYPGRLPGVSMHPHLEANGLGLDVIRECFDGRV